jgi:hypothetical protein
MPPKQSAMPTADSSIKHKDKMATPYAEDRRSSPRFATEFVHPPTATYTSAHGTNNKKVVGLSSILRKGQPSSTKDPSTSSSMQKKTHHCSILASSKRCSSTPSKRKKPDKTPAPATTQPRPKHLSLSPPNSPPCNIRVMLKGLSMQPAQLNSANKSIVNSAPCYLPYNWCKVGKQPASFILMTPLSPQLLTLIKCNRARKYSTVLPFPWWRQRVDWNYHQGRKDP